MHTLIYAGSLKVIPAEHSSLIGTHSSTVRFLGPSDGRAVPTQPSQRGVNIFLSLSLSEEQKKEEMENEEEKKREREKKQHTADKLPALTRSHWGFFSLSFTHSPYIPLLYSCSLLSFFFQL